MQGINAETLTFYDTFCKINRKVSFFYIVAYQIFISNFSRKDDTLRLFFTKKLFRVRIRWAVSLKSIWYKTLSIFPKMRHDVDFTTWRRNLSCVTTQRFLRRHVISRAFLSKRRKGKSVGKPGVYSHSSNSSSNSLYLWFREEIIGKGTKKGRLQIVLESAFNHLWEMIIWLRYSL